MFDIDRLINEHNKKMIYGDKPELPKKLDIKHRSGGNDEVVINGCLELDNQIEEIAETLNKIIEYLEWEDK